MLKTSMFLIYAVLAYLTGLAGIAYLAGFLADFGVPKGIAGGEAAPLAFAVVIDAGLVGMFGLHHSITARASFKRWWTKVVPPPIERATYLLMSAIMTAVLVVFWRPIPALIWDVRDPLAAGMIRAAYLTVLAAMVTATFQFGHFRFFGLAQAWARFRDRQPQPSTLTVRYLYAIIRHPISLGWIIAPWLTPHLTGGHVVFGVATLAYILAATPFEEADLIDDLGDRYRDYRSQVPAFVPSLSRVNRSGTVRASRPRCKHKTSALGAQR